MYVKNAITIIVVIMICIQCHNLFLSPQCVLVKKKLKFRVNNLFIIINKLYTTKYYKMRLIDDVTGKTNRIDNVNNMTRLEFIEYVRRHIFFPQIILFRDGTNVKLSCVPIEKFTDDYWERIKSCADVHIFRGAHFNLPIDAENNLYLMDNFISMKFCVDGIFGNDVPIGIPSFTSYEYNDFFIIMHRKITSNQTAR
jgi:hypothetical protein